MQTQRKITLSFSFSKEVAEALLNLRESKQVNLSRYIDRLLSKILEVGDNVNV